MTPDPGDTSPPAKPRARLSAALQKFSIYVIQHNTYEYHKRLFMVSGCFIIYFLFAPVWMFYYYYVTVNIIYVVLKHNYLGTV